MSDATADERRAHFAGLLFKVARLAAKTARLAAGAAATKTMHALTYEERCALQDEVAVDARALLRFVEEIEAGRFRGAVNRDIGTAPGKVVDVKPPHPAPSTPTTTPAPPIKPPAPLPTAHDYERNGPAPDVMALAAKQRAEKNADRRLPPEDDDG